MRYTFNIVGVLFTGQMKCESVFVKKNKLRARYSRLAAVSLAVLLVFMACMPCVAGDATKQYPGELITNGDFESPIAVDAGQGGAIRLTENEPLAGTRSLELNTLKSSQDGQKIVYRLSPQAGMLYRISYKAKYVEGTGFVSITVRDKLKTGTYEYYHVIGDTNAIYSINDPGKVVDFKAYSFFNASEPVLVIQCHGKVKVVLDDLSVAPESNKSKMWDKWRLQRAREYRHRYELDDSVVTPFTNWGKPAGYEKISLLTLIPAWQQRWSVELAQRFGVEVTPSIFRSSQGPGLDYWINGSEGEPVLFNPRKDLQKKLAADIDCIYVSNLKLLAFESFSDKLFDKVRNGTGLVIDAEDQLIWKVFVNKQAQIPEPAISWMRKDSEENVKLWQRVLAQEIKPDLNYLDMGSIFMPNTRYYQYGKGRIVLLFSPTVYSKLSDRRDFEAKISYTMKNLLWASGKEPDLYIADADIPHCSWRNKLRYKIQRKNLPLSAKILLSKPAPENVSLCWWTQNREGGKGDYGGAVQVPRGAKTVNLPLSRFPEGRQWIGIKLLSEGKVGDWKTLDIVVESPLVIKDVVMRESDSPFFTAGDKIDGRVTLNAPLEEKGYKLTLQLRDADDNLWDAVEMESPFSEQIPFSFEFKNPSVMLHRIDAAISWDREVVSEKRAEFGIVRPREWYRNTFQYQQWQIPNYNYINKLLAAALRPHGFSSAFYAEPSKYLVASNIRSIPMIATEESKHVTVVGDKHHAPLRQPCLTSAEYLEKQKNVYEARAGNVSKKWAPLAYVLEHEVNLKGFMAWMGNYDICFSPSCTKDFQKFLQDEYGTLNNLNDKWKTAYRGWSEIKPLAIADAIEKDQLHIWIDHRRHMDKVWTGSLGFRVNTVKKFNPDAVGLVDNVRSPDSYSGVDFWRLLNDNDIAASAIPVNYQQSFTLPRNQFLSAYRSSCWHMDQITEDDELFHTRFDKGPWIALMSGLHGFSYWTQIFDNPPGENLCHQPVMPDLTSPGCFAKANEEVARIRNGLDRFIFNSEKDYSNIAILYSRSSEHAATAWSKICGKGKVVTPFADILSTLGYGSKALSEKQVENDVLSKGKFRMLILPFSQAISSSAAEKIRSFAKNGGIVLADLNPAIADRHGVLYRKGGALDSLFGVRQQCSWKNISGTKTEEDVSLKSGSAVLKLSGKNLLVGPEVKIVSGKAAGVYEQRSVFVRNRFGKGGGVLLNFAVRHIDADILALFKSLMNGLPVKPLFGLELPSKVNDINSGGDNSERVPLADNEGYMSGGLSFGRSVPVRSHFVNGGIHVFSFWYQDQRGYGKEKNQISFPVEGHIYDLRSCEYLGLSDSLSIVMPKEGLVAYAVVPYQIQRPEISAFMEKQGNRINIVCQGVLSPEETKNERHVLQFELTSPNGDKWVDYTVTEVAIDGKAGHTFHLPLNAPAGTWSVWVTEALSGLDSSAQVVIKSPNRQ